MKRIEIGIVALCLIVAAFSIQRLFFNRTQSRNMSSLGAIGTVTPMGADVRLKSQTNDWAALENTEPVVKYDRVFTGPQSRALVSLESGSHLLVSPQTLVIISENEGLKELSLESGAFVSKMKKGDRIAIRQGAKSFVIEGDGQALIRKTDQNIHIGLLSGDLKVQENQKEDNLKAGDEIEWSEIEGLLKDKVKNAISLMSPMDGLLWSATDAKIDFKWSRSKAGESRILIAKDAQFQNLIFDQKTMATDITVPASSLLSGQSVFWKIQDSTTAGVESRVSSLTVLPLTPPQLVLPINNQMLTDSQIHFQWQDPGQSQWYLFEIFSGTNHQKPFYQEKVFQKQVVVSSLPKGAYYWRVSGFHPLRNETLISETRTLNIGSAFPAWADQEYRFEIYDQNTSDLNHQTLGFEETDHPTLHFSVTRTDLELSIFDLNHTLIKKIPLTNDVDISSLPAGLYQMEMQAADGTHAETSAQLRLILAPPKSLAAVRETGKMKEQVHISWLGHAQTSFYELQVDRTELFQTAEKQITSTAKVDLSGMTPGLWYYRVRSLNEQKWPISRWSETKSFETVGVIIPLEAEVLKPQTPVPNQEIEEPKPLAKANSVVKGPRPETQFWLEGGIGLNSHRFKEDSPLAEESSQYTSLAGPAIFTEAGFLLSKNLNAELSYQQMPGRIQTSNLITLDKNTYLWQNLRGQFDWQFKNDKNRSWHLLFGLEKYQVPFLYSDASSNGHLIDNTYLASLIGFKYQWTSNSGLLYEALMRYHLPFGGEAGDGGQFHVSPQLSLDGSLGVRKYLTDQLSAGLFWQVDSQQIKYDYHSSDGTVDRTGTQTHLNSGVYLNIKYEWFVGNLLFVFWGPRTNGKDDDDDENKSETSDSPS